MDAGPGGKALAYDQHALRLADAKVAALDAPARLKALVPLRADGLQAVQGGCCIAQRDQQRLALGLDAVGLDAFAHQIGMIRRGR